MVLSAYITKERIKQSIQMKKLEKQHGKPKENRRKEIIKVENRN